MNIFQKNKFLELCHIFFQKNANGPYWGKLHWGHITSDDMLNWKEEKIALSNTSGYDIKGNWSGCVFTDDVLTGGKPNIFYTGVDYAKASVNQATPIADDLISWNKDTRNPIIPSRPAGLSDDFRDPYVFKSNGNFYMIIGTSKNGLGATTLHKYDPITKTWSNLEILIKSRYHKKLLILLWCLWKRIKLPFVFSGWHDIISCTFWRRSAKNWSLNF